MKMDGELLPSKGLAHTGIKSPSQPINRRAAGDCTNCPQWSGDFLSEKGHDKTTVPPHPQGRNQSSLETGEATLKQGNMKTTTGCLYSKTPGDVFAIF